MGVCADDATVCASDCVAQCIFVFVRRDGALLRRFGGFGAGDGELHEPFSVSFVGNTGNIAVVDCCNKRVCVFTVDGAFVRHLGVGQPKYPVGIACSDAGHEIFVADKNTRSIAVFDVNNERLRTLSCDSEVTGVSWGHTARTAPVPCSHDSQTKKKKLFIFDLFPGDLQNLVPFMVSRVAAHHFLEVLCRPRRRNLCTVKIQLS